MVVLVNILGSTRGILPPTKAQLSRQLSTMPSLSTHPHPMRLVTLLNFIQRLRQLHRSMVTLPANMLNTLQSSLFIIVQIFIHADTSFSADPTYPTQPYFAYNNLSASGLVQADGSPLSSPNITSPNGGHTSGGRRSTYLGGFIVPIFVVSAMAIY